MKALFDPNLQLSLGLLVVTALFAVLVRRILHRTSGGMHHSADEKGHLIADVVHHAIAPVSLLLWYFGIYGAVHLAITGGWLHNDWPWLQPAMKKGATLALFAAFLWFFFRAMGAIDYRLKRFTARTEGRVDDVVFPLLVTGLRSTVPILGVFLLLRLWPISADALAVVRKLLAIALIAAMTWVVRRAIVLTDLAVLGPKGIAGAKTLEQRALYTRVRMLRRVAIVLLTTIAFAGVLMMFEEVRDIGKSILASAGLAGIVLGFAAQKTLGSLFAGIQIALTQPIRLGDQVIVEGDFAIIEEITLTYVVARTWDSRRVILPISYFIEKPFQNWTRGSAALLAPVVLRVDYSLPVEPLRNYLKAEIEKSAHWDKVAFAVEVTDTNDRSMEIRVLGSAPDSGQAWNLRCELREKAINFIRQNYPQCLPKIRLEERRIDRWSATTGLTDGNAPMVRPKTDTDAAAALAKSSQR
jgi:small-conductance mechanosensitive channel